MRVWSIIIALFGIQVAAFTYGTHLKHRNIFRKRGGQFDIQVGHSQLDPHDSSSNEPTFYKDPFSGIGKGNQNNFVKNVVGLKFMEDFYSKVFSAMITDLDILKVVAKSCTYASAVLITISLLGTLGFDMKVFLSLFSIASLTVGFAIKDILANTIAGLILLVSKPFTRGSVIKTCGYKGTVLSVDARYVHLYDHALKSNVMIPLGMVYSQPIIVEQA